MMVQTGHDTLAERVSAVIRRHQNGDVDAMGELFRIVRPWIANIAQACRLSQFSADDVVQSTIATALVHLPMLRDPDAGLAWLSVIARREAIRVSQVERRNDYLGEHDMAGSGTEAADTENAALTNLARAGLMRALAQLPERERKLLVFLFLDDGWDYAKIASELAMPVGSIGPTRQRSLRKVRAILSREPRECVRCA
jgi:RNA polymerase sigma factor (sigma-70 family)